MKVIVNKPAKPVIPPTTYDLIGLTSDEVWMLRIALNNFTSHGGVKYTSVFAGDLHDRICAGMHGE